MNRQNDYLHLALFRLSLSSLDDSELFHIPLASPILKPERTSFSEHGQQTHFKRAIYPANMFRLPVINTHNQASSLRVSDLMSNRMGKPKAAGKSGRQAYRKNHSPYLN